MKEYNYKIGDKVWIKEDIPLNEIYLNTGFYYKINSGEYDIRGKQVTISKICYSEMRYHCKEYKNFHHNMIDHNKTKLGKNNITYDIY